MRVRASLMAAVSATFLVGPLAATAQAGFVSTTSTKLLVAADVDDDGLFDVATMAPNGSSDPVKLFASTTDLDSPALSHDGTKVAYVDDVSDTGVYHLKVRASDGSGSATELTTGDDSSPSWSFDDGTIAFARSSDSFGGTDVYTIPATGGTATLRATGADQPAFTVSGRQLVVDHYTSAGDFGYLELVTLSTGARAKIAGTEGGFDPAVSPDGQMVTFSKFTAECTIGLYRIPIAGGTPTVVHSVPDQGIAGATYSIDGTQLFWDQSPTCTAGASNIWISNADGSSAQTLRSTAVDEYSPTVSGGTAPTADTTAPAAPVIDATGMFTATTAVISWTESSTDVTEYVVIVKAHNAAAPTSPSDGTVGYDGAGHTAVVTGLTSGTTYDLYVFAIDSSGNPSTSPSAVHAITPYPTPVVTPIGTVSSVSATAVFPLTWTGTAPSYQVKVGEKVRTPSGWSSSPIYRTITESTTAKTRNFWGTQGHSYSFQVRGLDGLGNISAVPGATWADVPFNDTSSRLGWSSGWTYVKSAISRWFGDYKYALTAGRVMSLTADTERFQIVGDKCASCGKFQVFIDGVLKTTVDTYAASTQTRRILWTSGVYGSISTHVLRVVTLTTDGRPRIDIDAVGILRR